MSVLGVDLNGSWLTYGPLAFVVIAYGGCLYEALRNLRRLEEDRDLDAAVARIERKYKRGRPPVRRAAVERKIDEFSGDIVKLLREICLRVTKVLLFGAVIPAAIFSLVVWQQSLIFPFQTPASVYSALTAVVFVLDQACKGLLLDLMEAFDWSLPGATIVPTSAIRVAAFVFRSTLGLFELWTIWLAVQALSYYGDLKNGGGPQHMQALKGRLQKARLSYESTLARERRNRS